MSMSMSVSWSGKWMIIVRRVVGAVPGQVDPLAADLQRPVVLERLVVRRPGRVVVAEQQPPRLLVPDGG
jgi:hypothetical protein